MSIAGTTPTATGVNYVEKNDHDDQIVRAKVAGQVLPVEAITWITRYVIMINEPYSFKKMQSVLLI